VKGQRERREATRENDARDTGIARARENRNGRRKAFAAL
jgi:hypothetical protein